MVSGKSRKPWYDRNLLTEFQIGTLPIWPGIYHYHHNFNLYLAPTTLNAGSLRSSKSLEMLVITLLLSSASSSSRWYMPCRPVTHLTQKFSKLKDINNTKRIEPVIPMYTQPYRAQLPGKKVQLLLLNDLGVHSFATANRSYVTILKIFQWLIECFFVSGNIS